jgi:hypothetical protein
MAELQFYKEDLMKMTDCYAVCPITAWGRTFYLFASDCRGSCCAVDAETHGVTTIWEEPGGTMSIIPIPGEKGEFLISQNFLPGFTARRARIMRVTPKPDKTWQVSLWMELPYVHRFDILPGRGQYYFLGCILSSTDDEKADWNKPGYLVAAPLSDGFAPPQKTNIIAGGMTRNHGYWRKDYGAYSGAFTACAEGIFSVHPPQGSNEDWLVQKIFDQEASDIALCDIDNDGEEELAVIQPFHGNTFIVYKKQGGAYHELYRYPDPMEFIHVVWGGALGGRNVFLGGCRSLNKELFVLYWENGRIVKQVLDRGCGPSNIAVHYRAGVACLLAANHSAGLASVYTFS